jgi:hypothetical protein
MAREDTAELPQPGKQSLHFPALAAAAQSTAALSRRLTPIRAMRCDQFNALLLKLVIGLVTVKSLILDQSSRAIGNKLVFNSVRDKGEFVWRSRRTVYGDRKTMAVRHCHELRTVAALGLSRCAAPLFANTKMPTIEHPDRSIWPRIRRSSASASSTVRKAPDCTHS